MPTKRIKTKPRSLETEKPTAAPERAPDIAKAREAAGYLAVIVEVASDCDMRSAEDLAELQRRFNPARRLWSAC